jgi:hypothetical protein
VRVTPDLVPVHTFSIRSDTLVSRDPDIAFDGTNYTVVWSEGPFPGEYRVMATRVTTSGVVLDSVVQFGMDAYQEYHPAIDFDGSRYLTVWHNYNYPPYGVYGRFLTTDCLPEGREFPVKETAESFWCKPDCVYGYGHYFVAWNEMNAGIINVYGRFITLDGFHAGDVFAIAEGPDMQLYPRICPGDSSYLVVWDEEGSICGQLVSASGSLIGENFVISDPIACSRGIPTVSAADNGCMVVWMEFHSDNYDIYGDIDISSGVDAYQESAVNVPVTPTIVNSMSSLVQHRHNRLYDVMGRPVDIPTCTPGVYFIFMDNAQVRKIIVVR